VRGPSSISAPTTWTSSSTGTRKIVVIPTYEGVRQAMRLVGFKNVLEVVRPGLGPTGEWREFLGFAR